MKQILSFILLFSTSFVFSQNIEFAVIVKDIQTGLPISEVTITALKTKQGFLTNKNGEANISLSKESDLQFENSAYKTYTAKPLDLDKKNNEVYLESNAKRLEEVILTSDHPQEILKKLVRNSQNKITIPVNLKVYLREFYKKNDQVVFFNDGLINFQIAGSLKNMKTDILVEQNRAVGLLDTDLNEDLLGYNLNDIIENYYQFQYLEELLEPSAKRKYDFQIKSYPNNENYLLIKVTPLEEISGVLSEFTIVYHNSKMIIIEVSSMVPDSRLEDLRQSFLKSSKIYKLEFKNTFRLDNDLYYLANSKEVIGFEKKYKDENRRIEVNNHMIITNFDKKMFKYNDENVFKEQSLINKKTSFFTDYWDFESGFLPTKEEKDIIERLSHL
ncbi:hypothetical protein IA01_03225 [Flavobacterium psychrophilum]|uniref:Carboxypeptidase-like regulatory domain-containing protein n=5 Tax=Flavobacterium psychrophilum TaxID=96345 RepID=A6GXC5_FLAPJ|nr:hypothetical protein [Flavobacterium psychrophilum]AIG29542.1 hypothetical protein IA03_03205 [Flavobacterium psychrophilum]AIG31819.1 hypothetical protein IA01_03225 [Flavobacterium psychrophilum]AIG33973.1 hypothetical protein IA02_02610 [Flavobacterium psychrophilum]AIG36336.1 hypothetical protein IA04_03115 [Flavobacterium psychrophilum]AIG38602.1 hypothetical protein IA05_03205 [Flavobacterium psychrophilum]